MNDIALILPEEKYIKPMAIVSSFQKSLRRIFLLIIVFLKTFLANKTHFMWSVSYGTCSNKHVPLVRYKKLVQSVSGRMTAAYLGVRDIDRCIHYLKYDDYKVMTRYSYNIVLDLQKLLSINCWFCRCVKSLICPLST